MRRWTFFVYGVACHLLFFGIFAYMLGFVGNLLVPKSIDSPAPGPQGLTAVGSDVLLLALFAVPHSVMARPWFKRYWTRLVPAQVERSTYVLVACAASALLMWQWRPLEAVVWHVAHPLARGVVWAVFLSGWLLVPAASLMINHFDLFGTRQVWLHLGGRPYEPLRFRTPMLYARIRHPLYVGWAIAFWAAPTMTLGHLLFAATMTLYMAIAIHFEERDLVGHFGETYRDYQRRVPKFVPRIGGRGQVSSEVVIAAATDAAAPVGCGDEMGRDRARNSVAYGPRSFRAAD